jgi:hypothetical protein
MMNSILKYVASNRLIGVATWAFAIGGATAWLAAAVYQIDSVPEPRWAQLSPHTAEAQSPQDADGNRAGVASTTYWTQVGKAAGTN